MLALEIEMVGVDAAAFEGDSPHHRLQAAEGFHGSRQGADAGDTKCEATSLSPIQAVRPAHPRTARRSGPCFLERQVLDCRKGQLRADTAGES